jgi:hypothetical protein
VDLSFEDGVERIRFRAFANCSGLKAVVFPASFVVIDEWAFCSSLLREVTFAAGSKLQYIGREAFLDCCLGEVFLPASVTEVDPSAFDREVWTNVRFGGPPLLLLDGDFLCSPDSATMLRCLSRDSRIEVPARIEVIGKNAFSRCFAHAVIFASGSRLRESREGFTYYKLESFTVPSSVEILGDRCFAGNSDLETVIFEEESKLRKIGKLAFALCKIRSFTIPASVNEIDGSAFSGCPLEEITITPGNRSLILRGNTLVTSDGTEIVKSFGLEREIFVAREVAILHKSCFESLKCLRALKFEPESKLRKISRSALSGCDSLRSIVVPPSVIEIDEFAFQECFGLEFCAIHENAMLLRIGNEAFAGCICLRSFYFPKKVERIGENCFGNCRSLSRLRFGSRDTLRKIVRDAALNESLEYLGFTEISHRFRIEVEDDGWDLSFPGWISVADEGSHLTLALQFS